METVCSVKRWYLPTSLNRDNIDIFTDITSYLTYVSIDAQEMIDILNFGGSFVCNGSRTPVSELLSWPWCKV
jgi:hypothetical protein